MVLLLVRSRSSSRIFDSSSAISGRSVVSSVRPDLVEWSMALRISSANLSSLALDRLPELELVDLDGTADHGSGGLDQLACPRSPGARRPSASWPSARLSTTTVSPNTYQNAAGTARRNRMRSMANPTACFSASRALPRGLPSSILLRGRNVARPRLFRFRNWMAVGGHLVSVDDYGLHPRAGGDVQRHFVLGVDIGQFGDGAVNALHLAACPWPPVWHAPPGCNPGRRSLPPPPRP